MMLEFEKIYDSWNSERLARHIAYWLIWVVFYATVNSSYNDSADFLTWVEVELIIMLVKLPYTYFVIYYLVPNYLIKKAYPSFFFWALLWGIVGGVLIWYIHYNVTMPMIYGERGGSPFWTSKIAYKTLDLIYIASLPTIVKLLQKHLQQEKLTRQITEQKLGAELKLLKSQLQPHFLFNTLNNLYGMVLTKHPNASDVVLRLSDMMSYMLYECERPSIALEKEVDNLKSYIELEKIRYGKRLDISFDISGDIYDKSIAPLLFIPFVENAFKHGVETMEASSWVRINLWVEKDELQFMIENSLPQEAQQQNGAHNGIGLANSKKRLALLYPDRYQLEIKHQDTYFVHLKLNL